MLFLLTPSPFFTPKLRT